MFYVNLQDPISQNAKTYVNILYVNSNILEADPHINHNFLSEDSGFIRNVIDLNLLVHKK